jgi:hypothetical protein
MDGVGNMRGRYVGLTTLIQNDFPKTIYSWCHAHRQNLVVEALLESSIAMKNAIGVLQALNAYLAGHKRQDVLLNCQEDAIKRTTKRVSNTTRTWRSVEDAVTMVLTCWSAIVSALTRSVEDETSDATTLCDGRGLQSKLCDWSFVACLFIL